MALIYLFVSPVFEAYTSGIDKSSRVSNHVFTYIIASLRVFLRFAANTVHELEPGTFVVNWHIIHPLYFYRSFDSFLLSAHLCSE